MVRAEAYGDEGSGEWEEAVVGVKERDGEEEEDGGVEQQQHLYMEGDACTQ